MEKNTRVAIVDMSINRGIYNPVEHWRRLLPVPWKAFRPKDGDFPDLEDGFTHLILTGSEASIVHRQPWMEEAAAWVREAARRDLPILGSCFGHQLLGLALGGPQCVRLCTEPEIGWVSVRRLKPSRLLGSGGEFFAFAVHFDEVVNLDDPFLLLASTEACAIQAFTIRNRPIWGIQAHPEIDIPAARALLRNFASLRPAQESLWRRALSSESRDSGMIQRIVRTFLDGRPEKT